MREVLEILGCVKVDLVVVMVVEEGALRSDTRLPLESSPYMAGKFPTVDRSLFVNTVASDISGMVLKLFLN